MMGSGTTVCGLMRLLPREMRGDFRLTFNGTFIRGVEGFFRTGHIPVESVPIVDVLNRLSGA